MSIKSDKWIHRQSVRPSWIVKRPDERDMYLGSKHDHGAVEYYMDLFSSGRAQGSITRISAEEVIPDWKPMIEPFCAQQVRYKRGQDAVGYDGPSPTNEKIMSYGLSSYGYDVRVADEFKIFTNVHSGVVDPKNFDEKNYVDFKGDVCVIPPNGFALARTVEYMRIPRDVLTICLGKSTYARCGIIVNVTPLEPEWEGHVTLEFSNTTNLPAKIYAGEGIAQFLFLQSDEECEISYKDRDGKYQGQLGVVTPRM